MPSPRARSSRSASAIATRERAHSVTYSSTRDQAGRRERGRRHRGGEHAWASVSRPPPRKRRGPDQHRAHVRRRDTATPGHDCVDIRTHSCRIAERWIWAGRQTQNSERMSVFEGLSLLISTVGTLGSVFIGMRQLRQGAPVAQAAGPASAPPHAAGYAPAPQPTAYAPTPQPTAYTPPEPTDGVRPTVPSRPRTARRRSRPRTARLRRRPGTARRGRPSTARHRCGRRRARGRATSRPPVCCCTWPRRCSRWCSRLYYGISYADRRRWRRPRTSRSAAVTDFLGLGAIALFSALLGIFVARGSRVAAWTVWVVALLACPALRVGERGICSCRRSLPRRARRSTARSPC